MVVIAVWQIVLLGMTFVFASHAARAGARALAVAEGIVPAALKDLPTAWRNGAVVTPGIDNHGYDSVEVKVKMPLLIPGVLDLPVTIDSSAGTVIEDEPLQAEAGWTMTPVAFDSGLDPIPGFTIGRDDMGVDACAAPGAPIFAPVASRLVEVDTNWYAGQPLMLFQFLNPPAGAPSDYWYVAEQITPATEQVGTVFQAHQEVAAFAPSGSCIEIGWGSATSTSRTLAGETDPAAANPPAGSETIWGECFKHAFGIP